ncbi:hypothetical protein LJC42_08730 [Eubacteriales bacterium OttesenSCG-928-K08]|nr:hypothetical protein [Eubacteriales bacterium OttesenSCG-928-K08]
MQIEPLVEERRRLYKSADGKERIALINAQLKPLRKELALCKAIEQHAAYIWKKLLRQIAYEKAQREDQQRSRLERDSINKNRSI